MLAAKLIQDRLHVVETERAKRAKDPRLNASVSAIKAYQQRRFRHTYADLLSSERHGPACRFFLDELYGPDDFSQRDAQFARVVPALVRLFPKEIVDTVASLADLHAMSERLDTEMGRRLARPNVDPGVYIEAWQATGQRAQRDTQIDLTLDVARALDTLTRKPLLRSALRMMRPAARAAGLAELQRFLERGFETFREMNGAREFVEVVERRERALAAALFDASALRRDQAGGDGEPFVLLPSDG